MLNSGDQCAGLHKRFKMSRSSIKSILVSLRPSSDFRIFMISGNNFEVIDLRIQLTDSLVDDCVKRGLQVNAVRCFHINLQNMVWRNKWKVDGSLHIQTRVYQKPKWFVRSI